MRTSSPTPHPPTSFPASCSAMRAWVPSTAASSSLLAAMLAALLRYDCCDESVASVTRRRRPGGRKRAERLDVDRSDAVSG